MGSGRRVLSSTKGVECRRDESTCRVPTSFTPCFQFLFPSTQLPVNFFNTCHLVRGHLRCTHNWRELDLDDRDGTLVFSSTEDSGESFRDKWVLVSSGKKVFESTVVHLDKRRGVCVSKITKF